MENTTTNDDGMLGAVNDILRGPNDEQKIAKETIQALHEIARRRLEITTGKIEKAVAEAIRKSNLSDRLSIVERRQNTVASALKRGLTQVIKIIGGDE